MWTFHAYVDPNSCTLNWSHGWVHSDMVYAEIGNCDLKNSIQAISIKLNFVHLSFVESNDKYTSDHAVWFISSHRGFKKRIAFIPHRRRETNGWKSIIDIIKYLHLTRGGFFYFQETSKMLTIESNNKFELGKVSSSSLKHLLMSACAFKYLNVINGSMAGNY